MGLASAWNPCAGSMELITATRSGSRPGGRRNRKALTVLNMVWLTAMPNARVMTATAVNPGLLASIRIASRKSFHKVFMPTSHPKQSLGASLKPLARPRQLRCLQQEIGSRLPLGFAGTSNRGLGCPKANSSFLHVTRELRVAVGGFHGKRGAADGDVLRAIVIRS